MILDKNNLYSSEHFKEEASSTVTDENNVDVEASDCEETEEDVTLVPTTDIPEVILVEEDEFTEKIDESTGMINNIQQVQLSLNEAVKENKVNESLTVAGLPKVEATQVKKERLEDTDLQVVETKFDQPEVEIINAAETILPEEPSSPTSPRDSENKESDPTPLPPPKIAFQEESSISKENDENSSKAEAEISSSSEKMLTLGKRGLQGSTSH